MRSPLRFGRILFVASAVVFIGAGISNSVLAETGSATYRLIGAGPASVTGSTSSPLHDLVIVGGAGSPVGISASSNVSVVAGGTSTQLPTDRIFASGLE